MESSGQQILKKALLERIQRNEAYSLRALARDLGVSHTLLSLVLSGKKRLSVPRAIAFSQVLGLNDAEKETLIASSIAVTSVAVQKRDRSLASVQPYSVEVDSFRYLSQWYHSAILELMLLKSFKPQHAWIAQRLGIKISECRSAVSRLCRLGLIRIDPDGKWHKCHTVIHVRSSQSAAAIRSYHREMIQLGLRSLRSGSDRNFQQRDITGVTFPCDPKKLEIAHRKVARFRKEMVKLLWTEDSTEVFQLNIQLFPLTQKGGK